MDRAAQQIVIVELDPFTSLDRTRKAVAAILPAILPTTRTSWVSAELQKNLIS